MCMILTVMILLVLQYKQRLPRLIGRFVPFVAIAAANTVNIPLMRWEEWNNGIHVTDQDGNKLGDKVSKVRYPFLCLYSYSHLSFTECSKNRCCSVRSVKNHNRLPNFE